MRGGKGYQSMANSSVDLSSLKYLILPKLTRTKAGKIVGGPYPEELKGSVFLRRLEIVRGRRSSEGAANISMAGSCRL